MAPDWLSAVPLAHRGLHDAERPENTLPAFTAAVDANVGIELDVHLTGDGHPVVIHDARLERLAGHAAAVAQVDLDQLRELGVLGSPYPVPTLAETLETVAGRVPIMIEVKRYDQRPGDLEQAVTDLLASYDGEVCVASFNPATVAWFGRQAPAVTRVQTAGTFRDTPMPAWLRPLLRNLAFNWWTRPDAISYELAGLPNRAAAHWRGRGLPLIAWTVRGAAELERARTLADNVIFETIRPG